MWIYHPFAHPQQDLVRRVPRRSTHMFRRRMAILLIYTSNYCWGDVILYVQREFCACCKSDCRDVDMMCIDFCASWHLASQKPNEAKDHFKHALIHTKKDTELNSDPVLDPSSQPWSNLHASMLQKVPKGTPHEISLMRSYYYTR